MKKDMKEILNYISDIIYYTLIFILSIIALVLVVYIIDFKVKVSDNKKPKYSAYVIVSGSMEPVIHIDDAIIISRSDNGYQIGDIITYYSLHESSYGLMITHRIVNKVYENGETYYVLKGDHNDCSDPMLIKEENIYGKLRVKIPKLGKIQKILSIKYGIFILVIPFTIFIIIDIKDIKKNKNKRKGSKNE